MAGLFSFRRLSGIGRRWLLLAVASAIGAILGLASILFFSIHPTRTSDRDNRLADPRVAISTPYLNVRPNVAYVGQSECIQCHDKAAAGFLVHPMGRSLAAVDKATVVEQFDKTKFSAGGLDYEVERAGDRVLHRELAVADDKTVIFNLVQSVQFTVGSGTRGRSYLINHDGFVFQSPISWYVKKQQWELSPGYDQSNHHFGRQVLTNCLFCHSNRGLDMPDALNRYEPRVFDGHAIGCERCHGPGAAHVQRQSQGEKYAGRDLSIVNPVHLESSVRDAVCEQCHLAGAARIARRGRSAYDFRPGLPLQEFMSIFVKPSHAGDGEKFVGQVEQMQESRCFQQSAGKMGCVTCHNPHHHPSKAERVAYYRNRCLQCHTDKSCSVPITERRKTSAEDSCMQCHMPVGDTEIKHASITDHRIPLKLGVMRPNEHDTQLELRRFHPLPTIGSEIDSGRDLALALMDRIERLDRDVRQNLATRANPLLEAAMQNDADDHAARHAFGHAQWTLGRKEIAARAFDEILAKSPRREATLQSAAALAVERSNWEDAIKYYRAAIEVNPWRYEFHFGLALALSQIKDWSGVRHACAEALKLNPASWGSRKLLVQYYLSVGDAARAKKEFETLLALNPPDKEELQRLFDRQFR